MILVERGEGVETKPIKTSYVGQFLHILIEIPLSDTLVTYCRNCFHYL